MYMPEITSIGDLLNHDGSIALAICSRSQFQPIFVTISKAEFKEAGGREGLNTNKQLAIDFYNKYGAGRP